MLTTYIEAAMRHATFDKLPDDGSYYGEIPGFQGLWANAPTLAECFNELREALEDWILINVADHLPLPTVDSLNLVVPAA